MDVNCWTGPGAKDIVRGARGSGKDATALRAAIRTARDEERTDEAVLWEQPRLGGGIRAAARIVLGVGCTVVVGLAMALVVVGADSRSTVLAALVTVVVVGGGFVAVVWHFDVGISVHADGTLRRAGWNGVREVDLRSYRRVTVKERAGGDGATPLDFGGD